jgi:short/branched chain acyl-CoA dehydrogenase
MKVGWSARSGQLGQARAALLGDLVHLGQRAAQVGLAGAQIGRDLVQTAEQQLELAALGRRRSVVHVDDLPAFGQGHAESSATHDQPQPGPIALAVHAVGAVAGWMDEAFRLVEAQRSGRDAELVGKLADGEGPPLFRPRRHAAILIDVDVNVKQASPGAEMTFELSEDHETFRKVVRDFAEREIAPHVAQWDREHHFPVDVVHAMGELGLFGLVVPEQYGGAAADFTSLCVAIEELGRVDQSIGITLEAAVGLGINPILTFGTDEQKQQWLPDLVAGRTLAGFGLTEPEAGSDAAATKTRAVLDGDEWVINGAKAFITNSGTDITSLVTITARTGDGEISTIIVPSGTPGFVVQPAYDKLGWHISDTHGLTFEDCRVPAENLLGMRGKGFHQFLAVLDDGRIAISALAVGLAQACLEVSVRYAKERTTFGVPIGAKQGVAFQLSDLAVSVEAARTLTYKAAALKVADRPARDVKQAAAIAKLYSTEAAVAAARTATQVFGGNGFMEEFPVARFYRDAKILEIGEGTSEVQRMIIARGLGLPVE